MSFPCRALEKFLIYLSFLCMGCCITANFMPHEARGRILEAVAHWAAEPPHSAKYVTPLPTVINAGG